MDKKDNEKAEGINDETPTREELEEIRNIALKKAEDALMVAEEMDQALKLRGSGPSAETMLDAIQNSGFFPNKFMAEMSKEDLERFATLNDGNILEIIEALDKLHGLCYKFGFDIGRGCLGTGETGDSEEDTAKIVNLSSSCWSFSEEIKDVVVKTIGEFIGDGWWYSMK